MSDASAGLGPSTGDFANGIEWAIRPYRKGDIPAIAALYNAVEAVDKLDEGTSEEQLRARFEAPRSEPELQVVVVEGPKLPGVPPGLLLGFGRMTDFDDEEADTRVYEPSVRVHPGARGRGLELAIARRLVEIAREHEASPSTVRRGQVMLSAYSPEKQSYLRQLWKQLGLREVRQFWTMDRNLDDTIDEPAAIEGATIRNARQPDDISAIREALNNSFADHWDFHPISQENWDYFAGLSQFRPDLSWVAEVDAEPGKLAGFCISVIRDDDNKRTGRREGWIEILGTIRGWRRMGLGRALLLHGLHSLKSARMDMAMLGVDSESLTNAQALYESVGFRIRNRGYAYESTLADVKV